MLTLKAGSNAAGRLFDKIVRLSPEISKDEAEDWVLVCEKFWVLVYEKLMMLDMKWLLGASVFTQGLVVNGSEADRLTPRERSFVDSKSQGEPMLSKVLVYEKFVGLLKMELIVYVLLTSGEQIVAVAEVDWLLPSKGFSDARGAVVEPVHLEK